MKYLKKYEKISQLDKGALEYQIKVAADEISDCYIEDYDLDVEDCPFLTELNILHQKDYIKDLYFDINWKNNNGDDFNDLSLKDFKKTYKELIKKSEKAILKYLKKEPELYDKYKKYIDVNIDVPDFIKNINRYNL